MPEGALKVARPSRWGNPYRVGDEITVSVTGHSHGAVVGEYDPDDLRRFDIPLHARAMTQQEAVDLYREDLEGALDDPDWWYRNGAAFKFLRGHDLACFCPLEDQHGNRVPCHADVLLDLANSPKEADGEGPRRTQGEAAR